MEGFDLNLEQQMFLTTSRTGAGLLVEQFTERMDGETDSHLVDMEHANLLSFLYEMEDNAPDGYKWTWINYTAALVVMLHEERMKNASGSGVERHPQG